MSDHLDDRSWRAAIDTLLGDLGVNYRIEITDSTIIVEANQQDHAVIEARLQKALSSSENFFAAMPYTVSVVGTITTQHEHSQDNPIEPTPELADTVAQGVEVIQRLFGTEGIRDVALDIPALFDENKGANSKEHVLYSKSSANKKTAKAWQATLEALLARFKDVKIATLRKIWLGTHAHLPKTEESDADDTLTFKGLVQECFGVAEAEDKKSVRMFFDYGKLHRLVWPPRIAFASAQMAAGKLAARIDKQHLLDYLRQITQTQGGALLRVYKDGEDPNRLIAQPVFFGNRDTINVAHGYTTLIIDRSGSMDANLAPLGEHIIQFIDKLRISDSAAKVRIAFFNEHVEAAEFSVSEYAEITDFITNARPEGGTRLFGTVGDELDALLQSGGRPGYINSFVVFTDGHDNQSGDRGIAMQSVVDKLAQFKARGLEIPQVFTMGYGSNYDDAALRLFADQSGMPFIHLQSTTNFEQIHQYLRQFRYATDLRDLLVMVGDTAKRYSIAVPKSGNANAAGVLLPFEPNTPLVLQIDGKRVILNVEDLSLVPQANVNDQLNALLVKANSIVASDTIGTLQEGAITKLKALRSLDTAILKLPIQAFSKKENDLFNIVKAEVKYYIAQINTVVVNPQKNQAHYHSLHSQARHALGFASVPVGDITFVTDPVSGTAALDMQHNPTGRRLLSINVGSPADAAAQALDSSAQADKPELLHTSAATRIGPSRLFTWPWLLAKSGRDAASSALSFADSMLTRAGNAMLGLLQSTETFGSHAFIPPGQGSVRTEDSVMPGNNPKSTGHGHNQGAAAASIAGPAADKRAKFTVAGIPVWITTVPGQAPISAMQFTTKNEVVTVFPSQTLRLTDGPMPTATANAGVTFAIDAKTARQISWQGRPAAIAETISGETVIVQPHGDGVKLPDFSNQLMLGMVLAHMVKGWISAPAEKVVAEAGPALNQADFDAKYPLIKAALDKVAKNIKLLNAVESKEFAFILGEYQADLDELQTRYAKGVAKQAELDELRISVKQFTRELNRSLRAASELQQSAANGAVTSTTEEDSRACMEEAVGIGAPMLVAYASSAAQASIANPAALPRASVNITRAGLGLTRVRIG